MILEKPTDGRRRGTKKNKKREKLCFLSTPGLTSVSVKYDVTRRL